MANNPILYNAALAGAMGALNTSRNLQSAVQASYNPQALDAQTFAALVDSVIPVGAPNRANALVLESICEEVISGKGSVGVNLTTASAIAAAYKAASALLIPDPSEGSCVNVLTYTNGSFTDMAGINAALHDAANAEVCFPRGDYIIDGSVGSITATVDNLILNFEAGATFVLKNGIAAQKMVQLLGKNQRIVGFPVFRFDLTNANAFIALDLNGQGCEIIDSIRFQLNADVGSATLLRLSGDSCETGEVIATGVGTFDRMLSFAKDAGTQVLYPIAGPVRWVPVDNGFVRNYGEVVHVEARNWTINGIYCDTDGRSFIQSIIHLSSVGRQGCIRDPNIYCLQNLWGIRGDNDAEFLEIFGGIFHQSSDGVSARVGSQGMEFGEGSVKVYGTKVIGYDIGVRFSGSCDSCDFVGAVIANNKTANMQIDAGIFPVSALGLHGGYMESVAVPTCIPIHLKSGEIDGMQISGFQLSSSDAAVAAFECDAGAVGARGVVFSGCRFPQVAGASVTRPNAGSEFLFLYNQFFGSTSIATGAFAANATDVKNFTNLSLKTGSLTIPALTGTAMLGWFTDLFTANFGAGIGANSFVELDLPFAAVTALNKFLVIPTLTGAAVSNGSLVFTVYLHDVGFIRIRGTNVTAVAVGAIACTLFASVVRILP